MTTCEYVCCRTCGGSSNVEAPAVRGTRDCPTCGGLGELLCERCAWDWRDCDYPECGEDDDTTCPECDGSGLETA